MSALKYTPVDQIPGIVAAARAAFDADKTRPLEWRKRQIRQIKNMMAENTAAIVEALKADLRRPEMEGVMAEVREYRGARCLCNSFHCTHSSSCTPSCAGCYRRC